MAVYAFSSSAESGRADLAQKDARFGAAINVLAAKAHRTFKAGWAEDWYLEAVDTVAARVPDDAIAFFLSLIQISEPTRQPATSRMPSSA